MMKKIFSIGLIVFSTQVSAQNSDTIKIKSLPLLSVTATRASKVSPFTVVELSQKQIKPLNTGTDLPVILNSVNNLVSSSDAGAGIGYTALRLRGNDITRINVTLNGVPVNDAEGQGVFFVNFADLSSSANSIQIQRGVGSSTNGPGAFAGSININSINLSEQRAFELDQNYGSFNTWRTTAKFYSGDINNKFNASLRLSSINSDGYIDRAFSKLRSGQFTAQYKINPTKNLTLNIMRGQEKTYQAWNGIPDYLVDSLRTFNPLGQKTDLSFYDNQTDNYQQTYIQLFYNNQLHRNQQISIAPYVTLGKGYYEEWRNDDDLSRYNLQPIKIDTSFIYNADLVRQLWLNNALVGINANYAKKDAVLNQAYGINVSTYDGRHYGEVKRVLNTPIQQRWYNLNARKSEASTFAKFEKNISGINAMATADIQVRGVLYDINGFRNNPNLILNNRWLFVNPKIGIVKQGGTPDKGYHRSYASLAFANKEPNRDDLEINIAPKPERLLNTEIGYTYTYKKLSISSTLYHMHYFNQLILTGKINDVGAYTRENTPNSYRAGIEIDVRYNKFKWVQLDGSLALSRNKIKEYTEYIDNYDNPGQQQIKHRNTNIAFSPSTVAGLNASVFPLINTNAKDKLMILAQYKFVGKQYLDNTQNENRSLAPWHQTDIFANYNLYNSNKIKIKLNANVYNLFNYLYNANGYTFSYISLGQLTTENYVFPQAGRRYGIGINLVWL